MKHISKAIKDFKKELQPEEQKQPEKKDTRQLQEELKKEFAGVQDISYNRYKLLSRMPARTKEEDMMLLKYEHKHILNKRPVQKPVPQIPQKRIVSFDEVKRHFMAVAQQVTNNELGYIVDDENRKQIVWLLHYMAEANLPEGVVINKQSHKKGVILAGNVGSGKSTLFQIFKAMKWFAKTRFSIVTAYQIVSEYEQDGEAVIQKYFRGTWLIDELGAEETANRYGKKENLLKRILEFRYNLWQETGKLTYITTNLTPEELTERYGLRFGSRMYEMFNILYLGAKADSRDFRKML